VSHRKPCGGFTELGLRGLGSGWLAAFMPGCHITIVNPTLTITTLQHGPSIHIYNVPLLLLESWNGNTLKL